MTHSLVIGGTHGLGRVVTQQLMRRGDAVSVIGRSQWDKSSEYGDKVFSVTADICNIEETQCAIDKLISKQGKLNYCVFLQRYRGKGDDWENELQVSLTATKKIIEYISTMFQKNDDNAMLMVSSVFAKHIGEGQPVSYHVAKAGLDQMMRYYALKLGAINIRVNAISPFTFLKEESKSFYINNKPLLQLYEDIVPLKRLGTTEDSANVISFLCSQQSSFLTGQNITVDGGLSLHWPESLARRLQDI